MRRTRTMNGRTGAASTYAVLAAIALYRAVKNVIALAVLTLRAAGGYGLNMPR
ncbi:MAG: hypothetical protein JNK82_19480 [Myxococcaceae bacterium]|nr:hypothetical protein [Myxococcaceae bacterium]